MCGEEGHNVRDRRAPKEEPTGVPTSKAPSGAAEQPETGPANATNAASLEGEGRSLQAPTHAQNIGGELKASSDEPGAIESQPGNPNANSPRRSRSYSAGLDAREESNTNANVPMHPVGTGPDVLLGEDGTVGKDACIEEDGVPRGELQEPGVSHLTTPEEAEFLTSPPSHTTPEGASMQRSPAINTMTPGILQPDRRAGLEPPHDMPPPNHFRGC